MHQSKGTWVTKGVPLKIALLERQLLQREAAEKLGMPLSTFNMKLRGDRQFTELERQKLSKLLGKPVETLFPNEVITSCVSSTQEESHQDVAS